MSQSILVTLFGVYKIKLWYWRRLESALDCKEIKLVNPIKEINPEYPLEGLMLKLKLQYFGHLTQRVKSLEKTLILGKTECKRRRGRQRMRWLDSITDSMDMEFEQTPENSEGQGSLACCSPWDCRVRHNFATEQQQHRKIYL